MKNLFLLLLIFFCTSQLIFSSVPEHWKKFEEFEKKYEKHYDEKERLYRYDVFSKRMKTIEEHNSNPDATYKMGVNHLSDLTRSEYLSKLNALPMDLCPHNFPERANAIYSSHDFEGLAPQTENFKVDWRAKGAVSPIKNQQQCGSCWSFSTTGTIEGRTFLLTNKLFSLSEQMLVDCDRGCLACNGCWPYMALEWISKNGLCSEYDYPYVGYKQDCEDVICKRRVNCTGYTLIKKGDETALASACAKYGPISVAVDASQDSFVNYQSGVYYEPKCTTTYLDHAVLVVGYGTVDGIKAWIVKNSWGVQYGVNGYIYMSKDRDNNCGIASAAVYPTSCSLL
ncbi:hypothetical protein M0812_18630 [Anaeramoeba flamelloides]|uniref:Uncharacterized protein n=1 Tax=Anaeramoeba flamelloides TaxID=1746091 RepID=A0AAV7Z6E4_9EUKA|nr:hypothetical protein M0812_18630 [Anaeramoeba flamelloides]